MDGGGSSTTVQNNTPPMSQEEKDLLALNTQLAQKQLDNINNLAPFQQKLLQQASDQLDASKAQQDAYSAAISPADLAAQQRAQFDQATKLGAQQSELADLQLAQLRQGGRATPEQLAQIKDATDAAIAAGTGDINTQTQRGIGLIADELANSRGLRLSDTPITREATLLTRSGNDQIASLTKNLRASQASAALNFPLAVQGVQSGININQQNIAQAAQDFQAQLRQQAYQNRLALTGQAGSGGIGLASIGGGTGALNTLTNARLNSGSRTSDTSNDTGSAGTLQAVGSLAAGVGALAAFSDRRLKRNVERIATLKSGIGLYEYDIGDRHERGVMADEVERVNPHAVLTHPSGYKMVKYRELR